MQERVVWEGSTGYGRYQIVDTVYSGHPARVLYSGNRQAAQCGIATDDDPDLLFDYNQRLLELCLGVRPQRVLLIGGAVGTFPKALLSALPDVQVDMVEPDAQLTRLGYEFFGVPVDERLGVFHTDGRSFLRSTDRHYDMVIVDAFVNTTIPPDLRTVEAFAAIADHLKPGGMVAMNVIAVYNGANGRPLRSLCASTEQSFSTLRLPQNLVLVGQNTSHPRVSDYMRYEPLAVPAVFAEEALYDDMLPS
jgi:spermidine synthase